MTSSSEAPLIIDPKRDNRYECESYSAAVSVPTVPGNPAWLPRRSVNPFVAALGALAPGSFCLAKPGLDYGDFGDRKPLHYPVYLTREGFWSREINDALGTDEASARRLLEDWSSYTEGGYLTHRITTKAPTMSTNHASIFNALAAPFAASEVRTKPGGGGRALRYITARHAMNRLDAVLGPENWWDDFVPLEHSVICRLTIRLPDGTTLTKCDAGGAAGLADAGDDDKSAFSDAFKRTCTKFGIARYLYGDGVATLEAPPAPPAIAAAPEAPATLAMTKPARPAPAAATTSLPEIKTGRELYMFAKANGLLPAIGELGRNAGLPPRIVAWTDSAARAAWEMYVEGLPAFGRNGTDG